MLRLACICLLISNIGLGALGYFIVRQVDRDYSVLVQSSLPLFNDVKSLSWHVVRAQRAVNRVRDAQGARRGELLAQQGEDIDAAAGLLGRTAKGADRVVAAATLDSLVQGHKAYFDSILEWRRLISTGLESEASNWLALSVRPAYDDYITALDEAGTDIHDYGLSGSMSLSGDASRRGSEFMIASAWPLWLAGVSLVLGFLFVVVFGMLIRWKAPNLFDS